MSQYVFSAVTPSDSVALATPCTKFYIGSTGNLTVLGYRADGRIDTTPTTLYGVPAGWFNTPAVAQVMATGTTASEIVAVLGPGL